MDRAIPCLAALLVFAMMSSHANLAIEAGGASIVPLQAPMAHYERLRAEAALCAERGDHSRARDLLLDALAQDIAPSEKKQALLEIGRLQEEHLAEPAKAITAYEQYLSLFPNDPQEPDLNLRLGRIYRNLGSFELARTKFYEVLYAALRVRNADETKGAALRAQIEIAHTHFLSGDYEQAGRLFTRLKRLDLPDEDRRDAYFRAAYVQYLSKDHAAALESGREFLECYPEGSQAAEIQYLIVKCLQELKRNDEALTETLKLLRSGEIYGREHPDVWGYWQQKTGNDIGNALYEQGEVAQALTVYQTLAEISAKPEWRWPSVYQIGLCFERLHHPDRAIQAYRYIIGQSAAGEPANPPSRDLSTIREMAQWRVDHLGWMRETETRIARLLGTSSRSEPSGKPLPERASIAAPEPAAPEEPAPPSEPQGM